MSSIFSITTEGAEAVTTAAETVLQLVSAANMKPYIVGWGVSFDGATSTAVPVLVELMHQSTAGTSAAVTNIVKLDLDNPTALGTGRKQFSAEPTTTTAIEQHLVHPQGGNLIREYPPGREPTLGDATTDRFGIRITAPAAVNVRAWIQWAE